MARFVERGRGMGLGSVGGVSQWPVDHAAVVVVDGDGCARGAHGDGDRPFALASVTKLISAYAALVAVEEGVLALDDPAGPAGSTVRHLMAHASGLAFEDRTVQAAPGNKRIYSNAGFEILADAVAQGSGIGFSDYVREAVLEPLGMTATAVTGSPAAGATSTANDLARFAAELQRPILLDPRTLAEATSVVFPGLVGIVPGYGRQTPNDWGLGFEIRATKEPHWTGSTSSARTFGHFGQSGTFLWVDPEAGAACIALSDRDFGSWAIAAWPRFTDALLAELRA